MGLFLGIVRFDLVITVETSVLSDSGKCWSDYLYPEPPLGLHSLHVSDPLLTPWITDYLSKRCLATEDLKTTDDFHFVTMNLLLQIFSVIISSFRAIQYPFEIVFGSIFNTLHGRTSRPSDTEALEICSTPTSKTVSLKYNGYKLLLIGIGWHDCKCMRSKYYVPY